MVFKSTGKGLSNLLTVSFTNVFAGLFSGHSAAIFGQYSFVFFHGQVALLQDVIHLARGQVGFLLDLGVGAWHLVD